MDQLAVGQEKLGKEIQQQIINYKADPEDQKSSSYFKEKLRLLEESWKLFEDGDQEIRSLPIPPLDHSYFTSDYYQKLSVIYEEYKDIFNKKMSQKMYEERALKAPLDPTSDKDASKQLPNESKGAIPKCIIKDETKVIDVMKFIRRQRAIIQSLQRLFTSINNLDSNLMGKSFFEIKLQTINHYWSQIEECNTSIWELTDDPTKMGYNTEEYIQLEERVHHHLIELSSKLSETAEAAKIPSQLVPASSLKLPKIVLPRFDGDYTKWRQFFDLFTQMVHNQPISNCQKMWYLKTNLIGEAEKLLRHFTLSEENYTSAYKTLQDRYENPRLLSASLVNKLLNQPALANDSPSSTSIKTMHDTIQECMMGLENLGVSTTNPLLINILLKKIDRTTHTLYEQSLQNPKAIPSVNEFLIFLEMRFQSLEALGSKARKPDEFPRKQGFMKGPSSLTTIFTSNPKCAACFGTHPLYQCQSFLKLTPRDRLNIVYKHNLCPNCLRTGHYASKCTLRGCKKCTKKHNTLLHLEPIIERKTISKELVTDSHDSKGDPNSLSANTTSLTTSNSSLHKSVLLATTRVKLVAANGYELDCRALLDSGSQVNIVSERIAKKLGVIPSHAMTYIQGIGQGKQRTQKRVNIQLHSRLNGFSTRLEAFVLDNIISPQPNRLLDISCWDIPHNIELADPTFNRPDRIDLLLGAELFFQLLSVGQIKLGKNLPILQNTVFGWIVTGEINQNTSSESACGICVGEEEVIKNIERFWEIEEVDGFDGRNLTTAQQQCELHYIQTTKRDINGRFTVSLPFAADPKLLGQSKDIARRRFMSLERKLANHDDLRQHYIAFMDEYINLGHMKEVDIESISSPQYFLPHHSVLKPDSTTTKLRVVFDASTKSSTNLSLNDILHTGPILQEELFAILLRFRLPRFVFTADIQKMYRQILVQEDDRRYQLIWWRRDSSQPLKCYQLNTVTYGTSSAPYLAIRCLQQLAQEGTDKYPIGSQIVKRDFYVDDVMTGADSITKTLEMQGQLKAILKEAGFELRKWCSNHPLLLRDIPPKDQEVQLDFTNDKDSFIKTLGLAWMPKSDNFNIKANPVLNGTITKRTVASDIARLFDPLGILAPVIVTAKIILQELWELKLDWDDALPAEVYERWIKFRNNLALLDKIKFPRHVFANEIPKYKQLHVFSDASMKAYGAAIYIRSTTKDGNVIIRLLSSKSKVAPLKTLTLPRLELCGTKLGADLVHRVKHCLKMENIPTYYWTDSEVVLDWINSSSKTLPTFVANRIAAIQRLSIPQQWRHVSSKENPADPLSRGVQPESLGSCNIWFYGPLFLHGREENWPSPYIKKIPCETEKERSVLTSTKADGSKTHVIDRINHRNSFRKLQRITGYVLRFINLVRKKTKEPISMQALSVQELNEAHSVIMKRIQDTEFSEEIRDLLKNREVSKHSPLSTLGPFLDEQRILRVGGRLEASELPYESKHPILLPHSHEITKLLMTTIHQENHHVGQKGLLAIVHQRFWPIKGKGIARSIVHHCVTCARSKPKLLSQLMGNLPSTRVQPARPFINSGVDFCGPIWIHYKGRGTRPQKAYIAVFCCFATKALHLEIVSDLTTDAFIGALKRFIGRRGHCRNLYCDNATNFVGARNQLHELQKSIYSNEGQERLTSVCSQKGIDFHFIPPRSPHFGGLWEAAVKSAKQLLVRTMSSATLTYEELETVIIEIEAILNSRPLFPMSSNPNDLTALTPGHFLVGESLTTPVDSIAKPVNTSTLSRWKLVSKLKHDFWKRWSSEYLQELQHRYKWKQRLPNVKAGEIVVIKDDNLPVMKWPLGRIIEVHKGEDGCVRVVDVRTATGTFRRSIHRLAPLPYEEDPSNQSSTKENDEAEPGKDLNKRIHEDHTGTRSTKQRSVKRIKRSATSTILTLLMACFILPIIKSEPIEITQFDEKIGIHFENLGTAKLISGEWKIIVFYDLKSYWMEVDTINSGIKALDYFCNQLNRKNECQRIINHIKQLKRELIDDNVWLSTQKLLNRDNQGTMNIFGTWENSSYGILDEQYATKMFHIISTIKEKDHLTTLIMNRTSIVDSTINIIKSKPLNNQFSEIQMPLKNMKEQDRQALIQQQFVWLTFQLMLLAENLQRIQSAFSNVITNTNYGQINPLLLSPNQLKNEFNTIRCHLPSTLRLPVSQENVLELSRLMKIEGRISNNYIIFQIKFPLVLGEHFELVKMTPIPIWINGSLVGIQPHFNFLAVTSHRDYYYPIYEEEVSACSTIEGDCEMQMLNNMQSPKNCKIEQLSYQQTWIQLSISNQWIFSFNNNISINVVCSNETFSSILHGSGILKIQPTCTIKEDRFIIFGHSIHTNNIKNSFTKLGIFQPDNVSILMGNNSTFQPSSTDVQYSGELLSLSTEIQKNSIHHFAVSYLALSITIMVGICVMWKFKDVIFKCQRVKPQAAPRKQTTFNYHIDV